MSLYITKEDIIDEDGILLLRKNNPVNDDILRKLQKLSGSISIDSESAAIYNGTKLKDGDTIPKVSAAEILQSFGARKKIRNVRILEKPNRVLHQIIFESKSEPWWIYINTLANYVDWLYTHSIDVAMMALIMAVESGYEDEQLFYLGLGALLHDIGMLLLPKSITEKSEPLDETEQLILCQHCELGVSALKTYHLPKECTDTILQHHERIDGSGYPKGLKEDEICLNSKMVMIADLIDTMTSGCPNNQAPYKMDEAIKTMKQERKVSRDLICQLEKALQS